LTWILLAVACLFLASASHADDILVPGDYQTIQEGIDAADFHDRVLVGPGTWTERIALRDSVHVVSTQGAETTIIDAEMQGRAVVADSVAAVFDGFTITNGTSPTNGAGMNVTGNGYEMLIQNCIFEGNEATGQGGGLAVQNATAVVGDCVFTGNSAAGGAGIYVYGPLMWRVLRKVEAILRSPASDDLTVAES
jgi:predicted outer membrane repeat protein